MEKELDETLKACIKLLEMIATLHKKGYELIRICPHLAPSGAYWRCAISTKDNFDKSNGIKLMKHDKDIVAGYSSSSLENYFDIKDSDKISVQELAEKFLLQLPKIAKKGKSADSEYAAWFDKVLLIAKNGNMPVAFCDYERYIADGYIAFTRCDEKLELPKIQ